MRDSLRIPSTFFGNAVTEKFPVKNYEVGIIVAVIVILGYMWLSKSNQTANPTNATSPGYKSGTP